MFTLIANQEFLDYLGLDMEIEEFIERFRNDWPTLREEVNEKIKLLPREEQLTLSERFGSKNGSL